MCERLIVGVTTDELMINYKKKEAVIPFEERIEIVQSIKKLKKTIIFATHNRELANRADYKLFISDGNIKRVNAR